MERNVTNTIEYHCECRESQMTTKLSGLRSQLCEYGIFLYILKNVYSYCLSSSLLNYQCCCCSPLLILFCVQVFAYVNDNTEKNGNYASVLLSKHIDSNTCTMFPCGKRIIEQTDERTDGYQTNYLDAKHISHV